MNKKFPALALTAVFLMVMAAACQRTEGPSPYTAIEGATVIDGISNEPIPDAVILIEDTMIRLIGPREKVSVPGGAQRINAAGKTIIPGILCVHGHLAMAEGLERKAEFFNRERLQRDANAYLYYGVTHMLSLGIDMEPIWGFVADQRAGKVGGAHLYTAGLGFAAKDGWQPGGFDGIHRPTTRNEAREMVRQEVQKKPDVLKIWVDDLNGQLPMLSPEISGAIIDEAHNNNLRVFAHMKYLNDTKELVRRGVDVLAHSVRDKEVDEEFLQLARGRGVVQLTTMAGMEGTLAYAAGNPPFLSDPGLPVLFPASLLQTFGSKEYQEQTAKSPTLRATRAEYEIALKNTAKIAAAGIPIALGTDSGSPGRFPGLWEHREMELLVRAGLTPMQAIQAATVNGARVLQVDGQYGSLQPGRVADLIILNADPLADITNSRKIDSVWMNGKQVDRAALATARTGT
ncbi:MAG: amidohydrolase family protein [Terriglobia bacterium]